jgi:DNA polymerase (family X)
MIYEVPTMNAPFAQVTKEDVAEVLLRIAAILELAEDNPYRALAYRRAARLVLNAPRPLHELLTPRGRLDLPGLGTSLRRKLGELVMTGRLWFGLEMTARLPEAATDLLDIPSVGPRLARRLYEELGISTAEDAIAAARAGRIRGLYGFGPRKEELILAGALDIVGGADLPAAAQPIRTIPLPIIPLPAPVQQPLHDAA